MNSEDQQDRIEAYLSGRLADPESFERELQGNPQLQSEMEATRMALDAIHISETSRLKDRLRALEENMRGTVNEPQAKVVSIKRKQSRSWYQYAAAAALLLLFAGYFLLRPAAQNDRAIAMAAFEPYDNIAFTITKGSNTEQDRAAAYIAYESGDFAAAETAFRALPADNLIDQFYLGQSLLAQEKYAEAAPLFESLAGAQDFNLSQESEYYGALARLGLGERDRAETVLQRITTDANHESYTDAVNLLEEL